MAQLNALIPTTYVGRIKFLGKQIPDHIAANCMSATIGQTLDAVTELTLTFHDPWLQMLRYGYFQPRTPVDYADYRLTVVATETTSIQGKPGVIIRCRPALVNKLKQRQGALVMQNVSAAEFVRRETEAAGGRAVVQPLANEVQISRDVPIVGEKYETDNTPSSWTTFHRLAEEFGYLMFEQGGVIYFGKPSWLLSSAPNGKFDVWFFDNNKNQAIVSMPICSRSLDNVETSVSLAVTKRWANEVRVGQRLTLKDIPTFNGDYLINSVDYSLLGADGEVRVSATTMKDPEPRGVKDSQLQTWMNGGDLAWVSGQPTGGGWGTGVASSLTQVQLGVASGIIGTTFQTWQAKPRATVLKAARIAVATAMQESSLGGNPSTRKPNGDGDAGIFQQRVLKGWYGTLAQVNDVAYGTRTFLNGKKLTAADVAGASNPAGPVGYTIPGLAQIKNWENMSLTQAAQAVQRSAFPNAYAKHEALATALVNQYVAATAGGSTSSSSSASFGNFVKGGSVVTTKFRATGSMWSLGWHTGVDFRASTGTAVIAVAAGTIVSGNWGSSFGNHVILQVADGTRFGYCHLKSSAVKAGQKVSVGQVLGYADSTGNVSGPHLHVECRTSPYRWPTDCIDATAWVSRNKTETRSSTPIGGKATKSVRDFVNLCLAQTGDAYVFGAEVSMNDADPDAFDCSELIEWAAARVGVNFPDGTTAQWAHCKRKGTTISVSNAINTYGALLYRMGGGARNEHVEVSLGNGKTIGAVGRSYGVRQMSAANRGWTGGALLPGLVGYTWGQAGVGRYG